MRNTKVTYVVMILLFAAGLWGILRLGSHLRAAPDVAGQWSVSWDRAGARLPRRMTVNQSGKFLTVVLENPDRQNAVNLRGTLQRTDASRANVSLNAVNDPLVLNAVYDPASRTFTGTSEASGSWRAERLPTDSAR